MLYTKGIFDYITCTLFARKHRRYIARYNIICRLLCAIDPEEPTCFLSLSQVSYSLASFRSARGRDAQSLNLPDHLKTPGFFTFSLRLYLITGL